MRSAGSEPGQQLNPSVTALLVERGLDPGKEFPKPLTDELAQEADVIITMGCGDTCPVYPGKRYIEWELDDPAGQPIEVVRPIVDEIDRRTQALLAELLHEATLGRWTRQDRDRHRFIPAFGRVTSLGDVLGATAIA